MGLTWYVILPTAVEPYLEAMSGFKKAVEALRDVKVKYTDTFGIKETETDINSVKKMKAFEFLLGYIESFYQTPPSPSLPRNL